jgi:hypothetical protein
MDQRERKKEEGGQSDIMRSCIICIRVLKLRVVRVVHVVCSEMSNKYKI